MTTILRSPKKVEIFYLVWDFVVIYHNRGFPMMQLEKMFNIYLEQHQLKEIFALKENFAQQEHFALKEHSTQEEHVVLKEPYVQVEQLGLKEHYMQRALYTI